MEEEEQILLIDVAKLAASITLPIGFAKDIISDKVLNAVSFAKNHRRWRSSCKLPMLSTPSHDSWWHWSTKSKPWWHHLCSWSLLCESSLVTCEFLPSIIIIIFATNLGVGNLHDHGSLCLINRLSQNVNTFCSCLISWWKTAIWASWPPMTANSFTIITPRTFQHSPLTDGWVSAESPSNCEFLVSMLHYRHCLCGLVLLLVLPSASCVSCEKGPDIPET